MSIPENNGDEVPKGPSPIIIQEWTDTRTFSDLKYTSSKIYFILIVTVDFIGTKR